jgi:hypothetical protein
VSGAPWPSWFLKPHGTPARYRYHYRHGEKPCQACREAFNRDKVARAHARRATCPA